jgi:5-methylcytosine-specific restriction protein A
MPSTEVDHKTPHRGAYALFWDRQNLQGLCKRCHARKTQRGE